MAFVGLCHKFNSGLTEPCLLVPLDFYSKAKVGQFNSGTFLFRSEQQILWLKVPEMELILI